MTIIKSSKTLVCIIAFEHGHYHASDKALAIIPFRQIRCYSFSDGSDLYRNALGSWTLKDGVTGKSKRMTDVDVAIYVGGKEYARRILANSTTPSGYPSDLWPNPPLVFEETGRDLSATMVAKRTDWTRTRIRRVFDTDDFSGGTGRIFRTTNIA